MILPDRRHVDQLSVDQFDPVILVEDSRIGHAVQGLHIQSVPGRGDGAIVHVQSSERCVTP